MVRVLVIALCTLLAARAEADPIVWTGACDGGPALARAIEEQRGSPLVAAEGFRVEVDVVASDEQVASIDLVTADGIDHRDVRARDCATLVDAIALMVVLAFGEAPSPEVSDAILPTPQPIPAPPAVEEAPPGRAPAPSIGARVRVGGIAGTGALPGFGLGATGAASLQRSWLGLEGVLAVHPARETLGAEVELFTGALHGCGRLGAFDLCAGAALGRMTATGMSVPEPREATRRWSAIEAGARWRRSVTDRLGIVVAVDGQVALDRPRFVLDDGTLVYRPAAVGVEATFAVEVRLR